MKSNKCFLSICSAFVVIALLSSNSFSYESVNTEESEQPDLNEKSIQLLDDIELSDVNFANIEGPKSQSLLNQKNGANNITSQLSEQQSDSDPGHLNYESVQVILTQPPEYRSTQIKNYSPEFPTTPEISLEEMIQPTMVNIIAVPEPPTQTPIQDIPQIQPRQPIIIGR